MRNQGTLTSKVPQTLPTKSGREGDRRYIRRVDWVFKMPSSKIECVLPAEELLQADNKQVAMRDSMQVAPRLRSCMQACRGEGAWRSSMQVCERHA